MLLKKLLAVVCATAFVFSSFAGDLFPRILVQGEAWAKLFPESCNLNNLPAEFVAQLPQNIKAQLGEATVFLDGKTYKACFLERDGFVVIVDEDGDQYGPFQSEQFKVLKTT